MSSDVAAGIGTIVVGLLLGCALITIVTGDFSQWLFTGLGILGGLWAVQAIR